MHTQLFEDAFRCEPRDLSMARHRSAAIRRRILPNRVFRFFPDQLTAMLAQVVKQVTPFHAKAVRGSTLTCDVAVNSKWIGSSKSAVGSVQDGSG
jgi:hypothetical protein